MWQRAMAMVIGPDVLSPCRGPAAPSYTCACCVLGVPATPRRRGSSRRPPRYTRARRRGAMGGGPAGQGIRARRTPNETMPTGILAAAAGGLNPAAQHRQVGRATLPGPYSATAKARIAKPAKDQNRRSAAYLVGVGHCSRGPRLLSGRSQARSLPGAPTEPRPACQCAAPGTGRPPTGSTASRVPTDRVGRTRAR